MYRFLSLFKIISFLGLLSEVELKEELFSVCIPFCPKLFTALLHFTAGYLDVCVCVCVCVCMCVSVCVCTGGEDHTRGTI